MIRATRLVKRRFPLERPASDARRTWTERTTLLVLLEDGEGNVGLGEAAPLPGYSIDSVDGAWSELAAMLGGPIAGRIPAGPGGGRELLEAVSSITSPAARFALETALVDLASRRLGEPAWAFLVRLRTELSGSSSAAELEPGDDHRKVAALLPSGEESALRAAQAALSRGIDTFKLKIGARDGWDAELATLRTLRHELGGVRLRADANQAFSHAEFFARRAALAELELEWLEEPSVPTESGNEPYGVPVALDESLQTHRPEAASARARGVVAYVLKPTALGGLARSLELARDAQGAGMAAVVSHAFEGPVAFGAAAALALALGPERPADGLDAHAALAAFRPSPALRSERAGIHRWSDPGLGLSPESLLESGEITRELRA